METQIFQNKFNEISGALKSQFANANFSEEDIKKALSSPEALIQLVCDKTGIPKEEASQKVHAMMSSLHIDDETAKGWMAKLSQKVESKYDEIKNKWSH